MKLFKKSLIVTIFLRIILHFLSLFSIKNIPFKPSFPYWDTTLTKLGPRWFWLWASFDGPHYIRIVTDGYKHTLTQAFFPIYPLLIKSFNFITSNSIISGLIISHISLIGFIYFFLKLGELDYKKIKIWQAFLFFILFPTSFYLFSVYTESLFLFLTAASFYFARKKNFLLAVLLTGIVTATKIIGIFLIPAILWEYYSLHKKNKKKLFKIIPYGLMAASGIISYLYFLQNKFNDTLIFVRSQPGFGAGREVDNITMFYQVLYRYLKMFFLIDVKNNIYPVLWFEAIISVTFLGLIIYALTKKMRNSYLIFIIPAFFLPTLTGTFSSMPRYVLACFPLFYLFPNIKSKIQKIILALIFFLLQVWAFTRFVSGQWVA